MSRLDVLFPSGVPGVCLGSVSLGDLQRRVLTLWLIGEQVNVEQVWLICSRTPRVAGRGSDGDPVD